ncbi:MAG: 50S ribosomal protein L15 [Kofleriaceae bacterium]|jgi:large subunit ribosomal protein L15|nr:50S ribosomal protein L15 [Kofleriaceae bacterium]MBP6836725.1 50S ribosomal protein L15 [Kofleriaceae bacterium]
MGTTLSTLAPNKGATKTKKRLGRGRGSGTGKTSGKGVKGQKARPGHHGARFAFEGGQMPMSRRIPKRGFKNPSRLNSHAVNVGLLDKEFTAGEVVDMASLRAKGLVPKAAEAIKILGEGDLTKKLTVKAHAFSATAKDKVEKAGGVAETLVAPAPAAA